MLSRFFHAEPALPPPRSDDTWPQRNQFNLRARYRRVLLKLSGESFTTARERGISMNEVVDIARQIHQAHQLPCEIAVVIGGGNILRGSQFKESNAGIHEATAHYMGMLATVINGLALQDALEYFGRKRDS